MAELCVGCPFVDLSDDELADKRDYIDRGGWVACRLTVNAPKSEQVWSRQEAMRQEVECTGARIWRRDRTRPPMSGDSGAPSTAS